MDEQSIWSPIGGVSWRFVAPSIMVGAFPAGWFHIGKQSQPDVPVFLERVVVIVVLVQR